MKRCPTCDRTFDDSMRFCQTDGTPLAEDAPVDPYKTMVASKDEIAAALDPPLSGAPSDTESSAKIDEEVLQLPAEADPKKTMYASEDEIRKEMAAHDEPLVDLPPLAPEPPKFSEPELMPPSFGNPAASSPPPSPFSPAAVDPDTGLTPDPPPFSKTTPPIPSPFDKPKASTFEPPLPSISPAADPEPQFTPSASVSNDPAPSFGAGAAAPVQNWQPNEPMQNAPIGATSSAAGQNNTLAIISLVAGVLGLTVCCGSLLPSILAMVLGFMAKSKATNDPASFGGKGLALGGIITGVLGLLGTIVMWIFIVFFNGMAILMQGAR